MMRLRIVSLMCTLVLIIASTVIATPEQATANTQTVVWSKDITPSQQYSGGVLTHGDNSVTVTPCGSSTSENRARTYGANGDITTDVGGSFNYPTICYNQGAAGPDGTLYYTKAIQEPAGMHYYLTVVKNGVEIASHDFDRQCSDHRWARPNGVVIGADGNAYALLTGYGCSRPDKLVSLSRANGAIRFSVELYLRVSNSGEMKHIMAYNGGIALLEPSIGTLGNDVLSFYSYDGVKDDSRSCQIRGTSDPCGFPIIAGESSVKLRVTPEGDVYVGVSRYTGGSQCSYAY